jgi:hypothetical protein
MRNSLVIFTVALASLLATAASSEITTPDAQTIPNTPAVANPPPIKAEPPDDAHRELAPPAIPACRQVCTRVACPAGQVCAPYCYEECM